MYKFPFLFLFFLILGCSSTPPAESPTEGLQDYLDTGKFHLEHQQFSEALKYFEHAFAEAQTVDNLYAQAVSLLSLSQVYQQTNNDNKAVLYFNQASEIIPLINTEQPGVSKYHLNLIYGQYYEVLANYQIKKGEKAKGMKNLKIAEKYYQNSLQ